MGDAAYPDHRRRGRLPLDGHEATCSAPSAARPPEATRARAPISTNPVRRIVDDIVSERRAQRPFPPGPDQLRASPADARIVDDPLPSLLPLLRGATGRSSAPGCCTRGSSSCSARRPTTTSPSRTRSNFHWREGSFGDLIPLLGDGLLTIDGGYHDRARRIMMPAFHREQIEAAVEAMAAEADAGDRARCAPGEVVDVYDWARNLAMRIAMRALLGLDPDDGGHGARGGRALRARARASTASTSTCGCCAARARPGGGWSTSRAVLDEIVYAEIAAPPRATPTRSAATSSACCSTARDEDGTRLLRRGGPRPGDDADVRRPRHLDLDDLVPALRARPPSRTRSRALQAEQDEVLGGEPPTPAQLVQRAALPRHGPRRDAAPLPAGLGRPAARGARLRVRRPHGARRAPTSTTARGPATGCPRSSPSPRPSSRSASPASARRRCRAAPTSRSAAARGSASASASARPR